MEHHELVAGVPGAGEELLGKVEVSAVSGIDLLFTRGTLGFILGGGALELLYAPIGSFQATDVIGALAPVTQTMVAAESRRGLDGLAHGVLEQIDVGGEVHIGFNDEGIAARFQRGVRMRFHQVMSSLDHHGIDAREQLRGEQAQVVFESLQAVAMLVGPVAVTEHLAHQAVLVGEFLHPVVVGIQPQAQGAQDQNAPLRHARTPGLGTDELLAVGAHRQYIGEDGEDLIAQCLGGVDVLQAPEQAWDVVAGEAVELDGGDVDLAKLHLGTEDVTHGRSWYERSLG